MQESEREKPGQHEEPGQSLRRTKSAEEAEQKKNFAVILFLSSQQTIGSCQQPIELYR